MARIRTIKPSFFTSLTIDRLPLTAQRTFIGLWTHVDDEGRALDDARLIKAAVWPLVERHTTAKVRKDLAAIELEGLIVRYEVGGFCYLAVAGWEEHQVINRPQTSLFPPPPFMDESRNPPGDDTDESSPEGKGKEGKGKEPPTPAREQRGIQNASPRTEGKNPRSLGTNPRAVADREAEERRRRQAECQTCDGMGVVMVVDDDAAPCPDCREVKAS